MKKQHVLDYPIYKEQNPEASMGDWLKYSNKLVYQNTRIELEEIKSEITTEEYSAALVEIEKFKLDNNVED